MFFWGRLKWDDSVQNGIPAGLSFNFFTWMLLHVQPLTRCSTPWPPHLVLWPQLAFLISWIYKCGSSVRFLHSVCAPLNVISHLTSCLGLQAFRNEFHVTSDMKFCILLGGGATSSLSHIHCIWISHCRYCADRMINSTQSLVFRRGRRRRRRSH